MPKNAKGGILVCEEELKAAFDFFDVDMKGVITATNLRKRLGAFHRSLSARVRYAGTRFRLLLLLPHAIYFIGSRLKHVGRFYAKFDYTIAYRDVHAEDGRIW